MNLPHHHTLVSRRKFVAQLSTAAAALALMRKHRGDKPVSAVIYTHSHVDHYGGVRGVIGEADIAGGMRIIAPRSTGDALI